MSDAIKGHDQKLTLHLVEHYPSHEPRTADPHYHLFNQARARLAKLGQLKCWVGNEECAGQIELHHSMIEFALANNIDVEKFERLYPQFNVTSDEAFLEWVEQEGNLMPLCKRHHTGNLGIHCLPYPIWLPQRFVKAGMTPAEVVKGG